MSFPRILTAVLCGGFLLLGTAQAQQPARELRTCKLRLAWWTAPENPPELALQNDKSRAPFSPDTLALSQIFEYRGEPNAVVLKKTLTAELDKSGKPITAWVPYCSIPVGPNDTDLAVLLFPDDKRGVAQTRVFDFSAEAFPFGSLQLINLTRSKVAIAIDDSVAVANSRGTARLPKLFSKMSVCSFKMAVEESPGDQKVLRSSTVIMKPNARILVFVLEISGADDDSRYQSEMIIDNFGPKPQLGEPPAPGPKGKAAGQPKGKKGAPAPQPEAPL
jgi:hypothetical protein